MATAAPITLTSIFVKPKRCSGLDSTKMVVEICKKLPDTSANKKSKLSGDNVMIVLIRSPSGDDKANTIRMIQ